MSTQQCRATTVWSYPKCTTSQEKDDKNSINTSEGRLHMKSNEQSIEIERAVLPHAPKLPQMIQSHLDQYGGRALGQGWLSGLQEVQLLQEPI